MGCCESAKSIENEVQLNEDPYQNSDFFDVSLESHESLKGFDFESLHTNKSTCQTSRIDLAFLQSGYVNA